MDKRILKIPYSEILTQDKDTINIKVSLIKCIECQGIGKQKISTTTETITGIIDGSVIEIICSRCEGNGNYLIYAI